MTGIGITIILKDDNMSKGIFKHPPYIVGRKVNQDGGRWYDKYIAYDKIRELTKDVNPAPVWLMDDTALVTNNDLRHSVNEIWEFTDENFESGIHGHHTGGIIASRRYGLSPKTKIGFAKVLTAANGTGYPRYMTMGINQGRELGYRIASASIGSDYENKEFKSAVAKFCENGNKFFFAAAGNDSKDTDYPAAWAKDIKGVFSVGAAAYIDGKIQVAWYSSSGVVTFCFPGSDVLSTMPNNEFGYMDGTSMATPFGAGLMSIVLGMRPDMNFDTFMDIANKTSTSIAKGNYKDGAGFVDVVKFLENVPKAKLITGKVPKKGLCSFLKNMFNK